MIVGRTVVFRRDAVDDHICRYYRKTLLLRAVVQLGMPAAADFVVRTTS